MARLREGARPVLYDGVRVEVSGQLSVYFTRNTMFGREGANELGEGRGDSGLQA